MASRTYRALLIANSTFPGDPHNLPDLEGPRNDPALLRDALCDEAAGLFPTDNVRLVTERTMAEVLREVEDFLHSSTRQDTLLLYYSGHGTLDQSGELFLCTRDTRTDRLRSTSVKASDLRGMLDESSAATTVIALDCCHGGRFKGGDLPAALAGHGRFVITSSRSGELANDAHARNHASLFTHHLVEGMLRGADDHDQDGVVTLTELYDYVHGALGKEGKQVPHKRFEGDGDVPMARRAARTVAAPGDDLVEPALTQPVLDVSETQIDLGVIGDDETLPVERVAVVNRGGGTLDWTADTSADWVRAEVETGALALHLRPSVGPNRANVFVRDARSGAIKTVRITVRVRATGAAPAASRPAAPPAPAVESPAPAVEPPAPAVEPPAPAAESPAPTVEPPLRPDTETPVPLLSTSEPSPPPSGDVPSAPVEADPSPEPAEATHTRRLPWPRVAALTAVVAGAVVVASDLSLASRIPADWDGSYDLWLRSAPDDSGSWGPGLLTSFLCAAALLTAGLFAVARTRRLAALAFCATLALPLALVRGFEVAWLATYFAGQAWTTRWVVTAIAFILCVAVGVLGALALRTLGAVGRADWAPRWLAPAVVVTILVWGGTMGLDVFAHYDTPFGSFGAGDGASNVVLVLLVLALGTLGLVALRTLAPAAAFGALLAVSSVPLALAVTDLAYVISHTGDDGFTWGWVLVRVIVALMVAAPAGAVLVQARRRGATPLPEGGSPAQAQS